jgi:hypothetical protein
MSAPSKTDTKDRTSTRKEVQDLDAAELQDRITHLRDQEREVQRELAERREHDALASNHRERELADRRYAQQLEAYDVIEHNARRGGDDIEDGARRLARGTALAISTLIPPALRQPALLVDVTFNAAIAVLSFERALLNNLLATGVRTAAT